ncbi:MAG: tetratricopeptide repeat protein [Panacagrimonas sp.]
MFKSFRVVVFAAALGVTSFARADVLSDDVIALQHGWARAYYSVPEKQKDAEFTRLDTSAAEAVKRNAGRAEPLVWQAIILSSHAKFAGGLGALGMIKQARTLLETAEKIDPSVLDGSIYTSLGSLYAKSPGWPLAFGDKKKARIYLEQALAINPDGIDPNYFYGELLLAQDDEAGARKHLDKALHAPPRPGREDADAGRRAEIAALVNKLR